MSARDELIARYQALAGEEIFVGDWLLVTQEKIDAFARVTGDEQWIHTDPVRASAESPYGSTVAHGFLTLSLLPHLTRGNDQELFVENYPGMRLRVNYGLNKVRFPAPVRSGSRIRARTAVSGVEEIKGGVQLLLTFTVEVEGEMKPACVAEQIFRLYP